MCNLTDAYIEDNAGLYDVGSRDAARLSPQSTNFAARASKIRERLANLPSASTKGLATSNDWVYEACRLAAIIYTTAIDNCVPFSIAVNYVSPTTHSVDPTELLLGALERTDVAGVWRNMAGVLYWVCAIGAAAARTTATTNTEDEPNNDSRTREIWVRRCLTMHATRTMIILALEHPVPTLMAQKRLLRVQELIASI